MKRVAKDELNDRNWDEEYIPEERGSIQIADESIRSTRKTKVAVRRSLRSNESMNVFKSFSGFGKSGGNEDVGKKSENLDKHMLNLVNLNNAFLEKIQNHVKGTPTCILTPLFKDYERHLDTIKNKYPLQKCVSNVSEISEDNKVLFTSTSDESKKAPLPFKLFHDETKNPLFTFKSEQSKTSDSENKFSFKSNLDDAKNSDSNFKADLNMDVEQDSSKKAPSTENTGIFNSVDESKKFVFGAASNQKEGDNKESNESTNKINPPKPLFEFGKSDSNSTSNTLFGQNATTAPSFSFGAPSGQSVFAGFGSTPSNPPQTENNDDEGEYVPPVTEKKELKEDGSVYEIRSKLFYKVDDAWKEKGVGMLFVKPSSDKKVQLIMRAENNLGTIMLNVLISKQNPLSVNKNNLSLIAFTTFTSKEMSSTSLLLRVKTEEKAKELCESIKKEISD